MPCTAPFARAGAAGSPPIPARGTAGCPRFPGLAHAHATWPRTRPPRVLRSRRGGGWSALQAVSLEPPATAPEPPADHPPAPPQGDNVVPGPPALPVVGNLLQVGLGKGLGLGPQPHERLRALAEEHGDIMSVQLQPTGDPWLVLSSPEAVKEAFLTRGRAFSGRPMVASMGISSGGGRGFAAPRLDADLQSLRRAAFSDLFVPERVAASRDALLEEAEALATHLGGVPAAVDVGAAGRPRRRPLGGGGEGAARTAALRPALRRAVTNMAMRYAFSMRAPFPHEAAGASVRQGHSAGDDIGGIGDDLAEAILGASDETWTLLTATRTTFLDMVVPSAEGGAGPTRWGSPLYRDLGRSVERRDALLRRVVAERRAHRRSVGSAGGGDMLDALLDAGLDDERIKYVLVDMLVAGVNTVSSTLEWLLLLTAAHPGVQAKARRAALATPAGETHPYVKALVMETMRFKAPLLLPRQAVEDTTLGGFPVAAGTVVYGNSCALTRSPSLWKEPERFRPERFFEEEAWLMDPAPAATETSTRGGCPFQSGGEGAGPVTGSGAGGRGAEAFKFMPYSAGQRSCPGARLADEEMHAAASVLLARLRWAGVGRGGVDLSESYSLTLLPAQEQELLFQPRDRVP